MKKGDEYPLDLLKFLIPREIESNVANLLLGDGAIREKARSFVQEDPEWVSIDGIKLPRKKLRKSACSRCERSR